MAEARALDLMEGSRTESQQRQQQTADDQASAWSLNLWGECFFSEPNMQGPCPGPWEGSRTGSQQQLNLHDYPECLVHGPCTLMSLCHWLMPTSWAPRHMRPRTRGYVLLSWNGFSSCRFLVRRGHHYSWFWADGYTPHDAGYHTCTRPWAHCLVWSNWKSWTIYIWWCHAWYNVKNDIWRSITIRPITNSDMQLIIFQLLRPIRKKTSEF
jgi:hypothetical protein